MKNTVSKGNRINEYIYRGISFYKSHNIRNGYYGAYSIGYEMFDCRSRVIIYIDNKISRRIK